MLKDFMWSLCCRSLSERDDVISDVPIGRIVEIRLKLYNIRKFFKYIEFNWDELEAVVRELVNVKDLRVSLSFIIRKVEHLRARAKDHDGHHHHLGWKSLIHLLKTWKENV
jgi:hypothetical protein